MYSEHRPLRSAPRSSRNFLLAFDSLSGPAGELSTWPLGLRRTWRIVLAVTALLALFACAGAAHGQSTNFSSVAIGTSSTQTVTIPIKSTGTLKEIHVLTVGALGMDYSRTGGNCLTDSSYNAGDSCTVSVTFTAKYPGTRSGAVVLIDSNEIPMATTYLTGVGVGPLSVATAGELTTIAGNGSKNASPPAPGSPAIDAAITLPVGVAVDGGGNVYFTDSGDDYIGKIDTSGNLTIIAAGLDSPAAILVDGAGNVYFTEIGHSNNRVGEIVGGTGPVVVIAGAGAPGYMGDGGAATSAFLNAPQGLAMDASGDLYIADTGNNSIRVVSATDGKINTFAGSSREAGFAGDLGSPLNAQFNQPAGLAFVSDGTSTGGSLYVADSGNNRVRKIEVSGNVSTVAGSGYAPGYTGDSHPALSATLNFPAAIALDAAGDIYISDENNNVIRKVNGGGSNIITTVAGLGSSGWSGDGVNADALNAALSRPTDVAVDATGNLFIADWTNLRVREVYSAKARIQFPDIKATRTSAPLPQQIDNDGNAPLHISGITPITNAAVDVATTTCSLTVAMAPGATCTIGVEFHPAAPGAPNTPVEGEIDVSSDSVNSPVKIDPFGNSLNIEPTSVVVSSTPNPSAVLQQVTFTATISSLYTGQLTGTVQFTDASNGNVVIGSAPVNSSTRKASITVSNLTLGTHQIVATFTDTDTFNTDSTSLQPQYQQKVIQAANLALSSNPTTAHVYDTVTFTVLVGETPSGGTPPSGVIVFSDSLPGGPVNGTTVPIINGSAALPTSLLAAGSHNITATYTGDQFTSPATSNILTEVINKAVTTTGLTSSNQNIPLNTQVTFTAVVAGSAASTPTGTVVFKDGTTTIGTAPVVNGSASSPISTLATGTHFITATYGGDADYAASTSTPPLTETVNKVATSTALISSATVANAGATVNFTVTVTAASITTPNLAITGTVNLIEGSTIVGTGSLSASGVGPATATVAIPVTSLGLGPHTITALYPGDTKYGGSTSGQVGETISLATSSNALAASTTSPIATTPVVLTATLTSNGGTPTGNVTFLDGGTSIGTGALVKGVATFTTAALSVGTHPITAVYGGDASDGASTSNTVPVTVIARTTTVTLTSSQNPLLTLAPVTITATVADGGGPTPTGTISFSQDGKVVSTAPVSASGTATLQVASLLVGSHAFVATYSGDAVDLASSSIPLSEQVQLRGTTDVLTTSASSLTGGQQITLISVVRWTGSTTPTGTVTFFTGADSLATTTVDSTGVATVTVLLSGTSANLSSSYSGDQNYAASTSTTELVTIGPAPDFQMTATPPVFTLVSKQHLMVNLSIASVKEFTDTLSLGCLGLPQDATCSFSKDQAVLTPGETQNVTLTVDTGNPLLAGPQAKNENPFASKLVMSAFLPGGLLLGLLGIRFRKVKGVGGLLLLLILAGLSTVVIGCGTVNALGTPAGVYHFTISATGKTGVSESLPLTMTVTQ